MAVPNPENEIARLRRTCKGGVPPLVVLTGPSQFFRDEAVAIVRAALGEDADVRGVSGDRDTDGSELQDLRGTSLFGGGCRLVVRRGDAWMRKHGAGLVELLPRMAPGCGLLIDTAKLDRRTKLGKALAKEAELFEFRALYTEPYDRSRSPLEAEMVSWISGRASGKGLKLTNEAALLLMSTVGKDPAECVAELDRLAARVEDSSRKLGPDDLRAVLSCSFESTPFELAEAILDGDRRRATRSLEAMFDRGVRSRDGESMDRGGLFPFICSWLYQALAKTYEGRYLVDRGVSIRDVPQRLGVRVFVDRFQHQVSHNPEARLRRGLKLLHEAQRKLRTTGEDPAWILRDFLQRFFQEAAA